MILDRGEGEQAYGWFRSAARGHGLGLMAAETPIQSLSFATDQQAIALAEIRVVVDRLADLALHGLDRLLQRLDRLGDGPHAVPTGHSANLELLHD